ncbi:MAG: acyltransferase family protein [Eisenbergiella sp.]
MRERKVFLTKEQSMFLRGIAILMVIASHYAEWYGDVLQNETVRYGLTRLGCYGVDKFFLVSGYGLVKSAGKKRIGGRFLWNRIKNTYLPYLLIVGLTEWYGGGISGVEGWYHYITGYNWWFIRNILLFYLLFFVVYRLADRPWVRMFRCLRQRLDILSGWYHRRGRRSGTFQIWPLWRECCWHSMNGSAARSVLPVSGAAFALAAGMVWAVRTGLAARTQLPELSVRLRDGLIANGIWTYLAAQSGGMFTHGGRALGFLGSFSLELYLSHMFVFYRVVNHFTEWGIIVQGIVSFGLAVLISWGINRLFALLWKTAYAVGGRKR